MVNYVSNALFEQDSVDKQITISYDGGTITNTELDSENLTLNESICSQHELYFGCCESSELTFSVGYGTEPLEGKELTVTIMPHGAVEPFQLGKYTVISDKPTSDRRWRTIVANDKLYEILNTDLTEWYNNLFENTESMSLLNFRNSLFNYLGVTQESVSLINDTMTVEKTIDPTVITGKDVLTALCEINACFGKINREGNFQYVYLAPPVEGLYPDNTLYPADDLFPTPAGNINEVGRGGTYKKVVYEDYFTSNITKVQIRMEENDIGVVVGTDDNTYVIEDNFLVYGKGTQELTPIATNVLEKIKDIWFCPAEINVKGNPCFETGDAIKIVTRYATIDTYILERTLTGIQSLNDFYVSKSSKDRMEQKNTLQKQVILLKGKANVLERTIEETRSEIYDIESGLSTRITQNASSITSEVTRAQTAESGLSTSINDEVTRAQTSEGALNSRITQTASDITSTVSATYETKSDATTKLTTAKSYADGVGSTATTNANNYTNAQLNNYSTTTEMNSAISQSASSITSTVAATYATQASVTASVQNLQDQIDNRTTLYTGDVVPTTSNYPAVDWTTTALKDQHIGDLYVVSDQGGQYAGFNYRWSKSNNVYSWNLIQDTVATRALALAQQVESDLGDLQDDIEINYSTTTDMNSAIQQSADAITSAVSSNYELKVDATAKLNTAKDYADDVGTDAITTADAHTDNKLASYSTTTQMNTAINQKADSIESTADAKYETITNATTNYNDLQGQIDDNSDDIADEVTRATTVETSLSSRITQNANSISTEVTRAQTAEQTMQSQINQNADNIELKVSIGNVSSQLSLESGQVKIESNRFVLNSTNCQISSDGTLTCKSANITGGSIDISTSSTSTSIITLRSGSSRLELMGGYALLSSGSSQTYLTPAGVTSDLIVANDLLMADDISSTYSSTPLTLSANIVKFSSGGSVSYVECNREFRQSVYPLKLLNANLDLGGGGKIVYGSGATALSTSSGYEVKLGDTTSSSVLTLQSRTITVGSSSSKVIIAPYTSCTLGFFGTTAVSRKTVSKLSSSATLAQTVTKLNDLIQALYQYGLIAI